MNMCAIEVNAPVAEEKHGTEEVREEENKKNKSKGKELAGQVPLFL
jgi:hypothetical protein